MEAKIISLIALEFGIGRPRVRHIVDTAPDRYKVYTIPKRRGGVRVIAQPSREVKEIQRLVLQRYLNKLPVHKSATAYRKGQNIADNANLHKESRVLCKIDFIEFFNSIKAADWKALARKHLASELSKRDIEACANILFWNHFQSKTLCLSIGAPSSPHVSNVVMYEFDVQCTEIVADMGLVYTRYADDITISGMDYEKVKESRDRIYRAVRALKRPKLSVNSEKSGIYSFGQRRMVTGLVLTPEEKVSIGRERKRHISVLVHKLKNGSLDKESACRLKGLLGFSLAVEPDFVARLRAKYGNAAVDDALSFDCRDA